MTTLQKIEQMLDKENLRNKELSFGCNIFLAGLDNKYTPKNDYDSIPLIIRKDFKYTIVDRDDKLGEFGLRDNDGGGVSYYYLENGYSIDETSYEIIGHDYYITDVLRWFEKKRIDRGDTRVDTILYSDGILWHFGNPFIEFDLSHPLLKNQSEETLESLYNLMESIGYI